MLPACLPACLPTNSRLSHMSIFFTDRNNASAMTTTGHHVITVLLIEISITLYEWCCACVVRCSRSMASQLLSKGKFGVFDPYHTNKAVELSAGLHCAGVRRALSGGGGQSSQSLAAPFPPAKQPARVSEGADEVGSGSGRSSRAGRGSASSLQSLDSSGSLSGSSRNRAASPHIAAPLFHSTRAAIPLMQDAFVCKHLPSVLIISVQRAM